MCKDLSLRRMIVIVFIAVLAIPFLSTGAYALNYSTKTDKEIRGYSSQVGINFSASLLENDTVDILLRFKDKEIIIQIDDEAKKRDIYIHGYFIESGEIATLTPEDSEVLKEFLSLMLKENIGQHRLGKKFLRTINLLYSWPAAMPLITLNPDLVTVPPACEITYPDGISDDLCSEKHTTHLGRYAVDGDYCGWASYIWIPVLKLDKPTTWEEDVPQEVSGNDCFGRCGKGCIGDGEPNNEVNIYTQDCFDHDLCVGNEGTIDAECNWMFIYAIDDFVYGPTCASDMWTDIKANNTDGPLTITPDTTVSIKITFDPDDYVQPQVDWWLYADTPYGLYTWVQASGWLHGEFLSFNGPPTAIGPIEVLNRTLPLGDYTFYFSVDDNADGIKDNTVMDSVDVHVVNQLPIGGTSDDGSSVQQAADANVQ